MKVYKTVIFDSKNALIMNQLHKLSEDPHAHLHIILEKENLQQLHEFIKTSSPHPFEKITLKVDNNTLKDAQFLELLKQLNNSPIASVQLAFPEEHLKNVSQDIINTLTKTIAPHIMYPLQIVELNSKGMNASSLVLDDFQNAVITNIQKKNKQKSTTGSATVALSRKTMDAADPLGKKIQLKELIKKNQGRSSTTAQYIPLEVQYVEQLEQELVTQLEEVIELTHNLDVDEVRPYDGQLLGFEEFSAPLYKNIVLERSGDAELTESLYHKLKYECFANLPHAIKFVSPDAAEQLALHLPQLVTLNKDNLPDGFVIKQTAIGELVLDYDAFLENMKKNPFTPELSDLESEPTYKITIPEATLKKLVGDDRLYQTLCPKKVYTTPKQLSNLWIQHGDEGVASFFNALKESTKNKPQLASWVLKHYLNPLSQWDHLYDNESFFNNLNDISHYNSHKFNCFCHFLESIGTSHQNLAKTTVAFDYFWNELQKLCSEQNVSIEDFIPSSWKTDTLGNPIVYMERILTILKNARSLSDQFKLSNIGLDNYGAFYASHYERFKAVSGEMQLAYNPETCNALPFNKNFTLYTVDLEPLIEGFLISKEYGTYLRFARTQTDEITFFWLVDSTKELPKPIDLEALQKSGQIIPFKKELFVPPYHAYIVTGSEKNDIQLKLCHTQPYEIKNKDEILAQALRFIGMQSAGITVSSLHRQYKEYLSQCWSNANLSQELLLTLLLASHDRYVENKPLEVIWIQYESVKVHDEVMKSTITLLNRLYKLDIRLNQTEGIMLLKDISGMNSFEFEHMGLSKEDSINNLMAQLEQNKYAVYKMFDFRAKNQSAKWPIIYALDTAEFLGEDLHIAATYHADLLTFAAMLSAESQDAYFHERFKTPDEKATGAYKTVMSNLKRVKHYLHQAATEAQPNNLYYAIQSIISAKKYTTYGKFLAACDEICQLPSFDNAMVNGILKKHDIAISNAMPEIFTKENADIKAIMVRLYMTLESVKHQDKPLSDPAKRILEEELHGLSISALQAKLQKSWEDSGVLLAVAGKLMLKSILKDLKDYAIKSAFETSKDAPLLKAIEKKIGEVPNFQDYPDFDKLNIISNEVGKIASLVKELRSNAYVLEHEESLARLFSSIRFSKVYYETWFNLFSFLQAMRERNYVPLLQIILQNTTIENKTHFEALIQHLQTLSMSGVPTHYLEVMSRHIIAHPDEVTIADIISKITIVYHHDNHDPVLNLIMSQSQLSWAQINAVLEIRQDLEINQTKLADWLGFIIHNQTFDALSQVMKDLPPIKKNQVLDIIAKGHVLTREHSPINYQELAVFLIKLSDTDRSRLHAFYETTPISASCLLNALKKTQKLEHFEEFISEFEKAPFGARDIAQQFSTAEVERVINNVIDMRTGTIYPYHYRKQLMEAFLFINAIGKDLPVFNNKSAIELTNAEIRTCFANLKNMPNLDPFQKRLCALALMREATYRATGEFPYSTQMIALIDGVMHSADFVSNIDTGEGKSQNDTMKSVLLWLDSDRVEIMTSSIVDAKRDIEKYGQLLRFLDIPYSETPISSTSPIEAFQRNGINFTTLSQMSLFYAKAHVTGLELDTPESVLSVVLNESDYAILDSSVITRFATADGAGINFGQEWVYYAINEFVSRSEFITSNHSAADDISDLKNFLKYKARELKKSAKIVDKFSDDHYLSWLESALTVNYILKENEDYVIPEGFEKKVINGTEFRTKVVKVLLKDQRVSPDSVFGNGIQQLLYARLNHDRGCTDFVIEPQNKTIISSNNKNLIDFYRAHKGFIWCSSGTAGSLFEIAEQFRKYGFEFSKFEPHKKNRVIYHAPEIEPDEEAQFTKLIQSVTQKPSLAPTVVFCKDINTAKRLFKQLEANNPKHLPTQLYTGLGQEEEYISKAAQPGMITITTAALGRNTDIKYDKTLGLRVWHTSVGSIRSMGQKSGRTGRQGSAGEVYFLFNQRELGSKTQEQIHQELDKKLALERDFNESLYNVLGYLLQHIANIPDEAFTRGKTQFLRESWSKFSADTESSYQLSHRHGTHNDAVFLEKTVAGFNQMRQASLKTAVPELTLEAVKKAIETSHPELPKSPSYDKPVTLEDCVPPVDIAYQVLHYGSDTSTAVTKDIKDQLRTVFQNLSEHTMLDTHTTYLRYLSSLPATQMTIVTAHKEFVTEFLQEHSKKLSGVERWFGYEGNLNKMMSNPHYLTMFYAFSKVPHQSLELDVVKQAVNTLLDEYLETSWFISSDRKKWAAELQDAVRAATDLDALVDAIATMQVQTAQKDVAENKGRIKPIHFFGSSRFQTTLNRALNLTSALGGTVNAKEVSKPLLPLIHELTGESIEDPTTDALNNMALPDSKDKGNAAVIKESLENLNTIKNRKGYEKGMIGRHKLFNTPSNKNASDEQQSNEKNSHPKSVK